MGSGATTAKLAAKDAVSAAVANSNPEDLEEFFARLPMEAQAKCAKAVHGVSNTGIGGLDACEAAKVHDRFRKCVEFQHPTTQVKHEVSGTQLRKQEGAKKLQAKGFTVAQLLKFYDAYHRTGQVEAGTTTNEVVRDIIIPETATPPRCYMKSNFMQTLGGGQVAEKLVSHAWKSKFVNTVLNIILDATERPPVCFTTLYSWPVGGSKHVFANGILEADFLLKELPHTILAKTYWLCIFAVDEHHAICGDCWACSKAIAWKADIVTHLRADPCLLCKQAKYNPCSCGSVKFEAGDPNYEIDLFDYVVADMDALVVSLDPDLNSIKRVWVVAEIGTAMQICHVLFRLCSPLSKVIATKLEQGEELMPSVIKCDATSIEDKERILSDIRKMEGGTVAYDNFINCMLELRFGIFLRLKQLEGAAAQAASSLQKLDMDFTWKGTSLIALADCCSFFANLNTLTINCNRCSNLKSIQEFGERIGDCQALASVTFNFTACTGLTSIDGLGKGLGRCKALTSATFYFARCTSLTSIDGLGQGLGHCQELASTKFVFGVTGLTCIDELGQGLGHCQALTSARFSFSLCTGLTSINCLSQGLSQCHELASAAFELTGCKGLTSIDELGQGLGHCQALASADFDFSGCTGLTSIDGFGQGLGHCHALASAALNFNSCTGLSSIDGFGQGVGHCQALASVTCEFNRCTGLTCIDALGQGFGHCQALASAVFTFSGCTGLTSIDGFGQGVGHCQALASAVFNFSWCTNLSSIDGLGQGLGHCQVLASATCDFSFCAGLISIDALGQGLGQCHALASATLIFNNCRDLTSIDGLGKGLCQCPALAAVRFGFDFCTGLTSIDGLGQGLGHCQTLASTIFSFQVCTGLTSIDGFAQGLGHCQALASATFNFKYCACPTSIDALEKALVHCRKCVIER